MSASICARIDISWRLNGAFKVLEKVLFGLAAARVKERFGGGLIAASIWFLFVKYIFLFIVKAYQWA